jgi:hypothetical protein
LLRSNRNKSCNTMDDDDPLAVEVWDRSDRKNVLCDADVAALLGVSHAHPAAKEQRCRVLIVFVFELAAWLRLNEHRLVTMGGNPSPLPHQKQIVAVLASLWFEPAFGAYVRALFPESTRIGKSARAAAAAVQQQQEHGDGDGDGDGDDALPLRPLSGKEQGYLVHVALIAAATINAVSEKGGAEHGAEHGAAADGAGGGGGQSRDRGEPPAVRIKDPHALFHKVGEVIVAEAATLAASLRPGGMTGGTSIPAIRPKRVKQLHVAGFDANYTDGAGVLSRFPYFTSQEGVRVHVVGDGGAGAAAAAAAVAAQADEEADEENDDMDDMSAAVDSVVSTAACLPTCHTRQDELQGVQQQRTLERQRGKALAADSTVLRKNLVAAVDAAEDFTAYVYRGHH